MMNSERMKEYWRTYAEIIDTKFVDKKAKDESISSLIKWGLNNKRLVMTQNGDDRKIFAATLDDIKKQNYWLVEDIPKSDWGLEDPDMTEDQHEMIEEFRNSVISINTILESN